jgi:predicted metal-binding membrane protein
MSQSAFESLLRRERVVVGVALGLFVLAAWVYLVYLASGMADMADMAEMPDMHPWSWMEFGALVVMWAVMMFAMMMPAAAPMILTFATVHRRRAAAAEPSVATVIFVLGYCVVWIGYSVAAAAGQTALHAAALLSSGMVATTPLLAGGLLIAAGVFQWTPLKRACLAACRSPLSFLMSRWRDNAGGAFVMGLRHGLYCLGCCWALMGLLFVAGVMNLFWVAAIAVIVLVEKVAPRGETVGRVAGLGLTAAGVLLLVRSIVSS